MNTLATKETAYANALVAASITHAVSKACQQGMIPQVICQATNENEYDVQQLTAAQRRQANVSYIRSQQYNCK